MQIGSWRRAEESSIWPSSAGRGRLGDVCAMGARATASRLRTLERLRNACGERAVMQFVRSAVLICLMTAGAPLSLPAAEPDFQIVVADKVFRGPDGILYKDGDTVCKIQEEQYNANAGTTAITSLGYAQKPGLGQGCEFFLHSSGNVVFWQGWATASYSCPNGYTGPWTDANGLKNCSRNNAVPVIKPPICPQCQVGNPVDIAGADKLYHATDLAAVDGLGFRRTYHSNLPVFYGRGPASIGPAWFGDHTQLLHVLAGEGNYASKIYAYRPDGTVVLFLRSDSTSAWRSEQDERRFTLSETTLGDATPGFLLTLADGTVETYSLKGEILSSRLASGDTHAYEYASGKLVRVRNQKGRSLEFSHYPTGQIERVADLSGRFVEFTYEADGRLKIAANGATSETYVYNTHPTRNTYLTAIVDSGGGVVRSYAYDSNYRPASTAYAAGADRYAVEYKSTYVGVTTPLEAMTKYYFDNRLGRRVITKIEKTCAGCTTDVITFKYDANLNITERQGGTSKTCYAHDLVRNLEAVRVEGAQASFDCATLSGTGFSRKITTQWHPQLRMPTQAETFDAASILISRTTHGYNSRGQQVSTATYDAAAGTTRSITLTYCEQPGVDGGTCPQIGLLLSVDGPRTDVSDVTQYQYYVADHPGCATSPDACAWRKGDLWKSTNAAGQSIETLRYDGAGRALSTMDSNGVITDFTYDLRGRPTGRVTRASN